MAVTPGHTGDAVVAGGTRSFPTRVVPPVELPASTSYLAAAAAAQLGWKGVVLPEVTMLGRRVCVVARLRTDVHAERIACGIGPVADRTTVSTWMWPEFAPTAPAPAAEIVGVLSVARHWRTGMAATVPFARYGEAAMVLPTPAVLSKDYVDNCLPRARSYGLSVVSADSDASVALDVSDRRERTLLPQDAVSRWMNEMVYEQLLASYDLPVA
ncbi:hypothetical protein FHX82_000300 [Amycolatopsis bartoniae]|uniref:Uncharacterized protein n=1 Tax=Amycolatopsis bartoniae TaxID=941986 RepID=A0A8H9ISP1_9PSEU|nr:hypothetical protein [Amycolatopsis bartoniae]MBB2933280.1 hypothetical protein [Amycolatopsis bartoniae]TVT08109.1 hypothetical protein FNH07_14140 [Amycolatopsis bartoniae]GHF58362.1 hypothetical protein GCM10017566_34640 [Amycolatopsis bartoniae]